MMRLTLTHHVRGSLTHHMHDLLRVSFSVSSCACADLWEGKECCKYTVGSRPCLGFVCMLQAPTNLPLYQTYTIAAGSLVPTLAPKHNKGHRISQAWSLFLIPLLLSLLWGVSTYVSKQASKQCVGLDVDPGPPHQHGTISLPTIGSSASHD
eukprot:1156151-Pelagomonas_calceolata.AAC.7